MSSYLFTQSAKKINQEESIVALESGKVLFFPDYYYEKSDVSLMTDDILDGQHKNISYDYKRKKLGGYKKEIPQLQHTLEEFMRGYAEYAQQLIHQALPSYKSHLQWGRTSFRPAQIDGRVSSKRKDDTRLHVDSFPATPVNGRRILRVFCNINPKNEPRVWNIGEPFVDVLDQFAPHIPTYSRFKAQLLKWVKATKTLRSPYDHYMLHLHDTMKLDDDYQKQVEKIQVDFPAKSSWVVFTDHVSHAALSGQYLLEQTFYLPVEHMAKPELSPLNQWKKIKPD